MKLLQLISSRLINLLLILDLEVSYLRFPKKICCGSSGFFFKLKKITGEKPWLIELDMFKLPQPKLLPFSF